MEVKANFQETEYTYTNVAELMAHVATMGAAGWTLVYSSHIALKCVYRKDL